MPSPDLTPSPSAAPAGADRVDHGPSGPADAAGYRAEVGRARDGAAAAMKAPDDPQRIFARYFRGEIAQDELVRLLKNFNSIAADTIVRESKKGAGAAVSLDKPAGDQYTTSRRNSRIHAEMEKEYAKTSPDRERLSTVEDDPGDEQKKTSASKMEEVKEVRQEKQEEQFSKFDAVDNSTLFDKESAEAVRTAQWIEQSRKEAVEQQRRAEEERQDRAEEEAEQEGSAASFARLKTSAEKDAAREERSRRVKTGLDVSQAGRSEARQGQVLDGPAATAATGDTARSSGSAATWDALVMLGTARVGPVLFYLLHDEESGRFLAALGSVDAGLTGAGRPAPAFVSARDDGSIVVRAAAASAGHELVISPSGVTWNGRPAAWEGRISGR